MQRHNEQVRQSRETLKTISEAVLIYSKQELALGVTISRMIALIIEIIGSYLSALQNLILSLNVVSIGS